MKLIIDISEDTYTECQGHIYFPDTGAELFDAVKNGIPVSAEGEYVKKEDIKKKYRQSLIDGLTDDERGLDLSVYADVACTRFNEFVDDLPTYSFPEREKETDLITLNAQGLEEGIRCAMCTNSMANDRGCDGGCVVDTAMYERVLKVIKECTVPERETTDRIEYGTDGQPYKYFISSDIPEREKGTDTFFREATKEERESIDKYIKSISFPDREKRTDKAYFVDSAVSDNCKNLSESYGEICVKCNKCGRYDR